MSEHLWLNSYPSNADWHKKFDGAPLFKVVDDSVAAFGDKVALEFLGREITYGELGEMIDRMTAGLQSIGVKKGIHVGIFMPNCPQFVITYFAILKAGGTVVNYSPLYSVPELMKQVEDSETDVMVTLNLAALYPQIRKVAEQSRLKKLVVSGFDWGLPFPKNILFRLFKKSMVAPVVKDEYHVDFADLVKCVEPRQPVEINPDEDVAVLQYTGGTTGVPKGAMLTHSNIYLNVEQMVEWTHNIEMGNEVTPGFLPFFHVFAMTVVMVLGVRTGARIPILPKFELEEAVKLMRRERPTMFAGVPTMYTAMLSMGSGKEIGLDRVKNTMSGGAPLPMELARSFREKMGVTVTEGYGLTEASPVVCTNRYDQPSVIGSIGLPLPGTEIIIVDREDHTKEMPVGEAGEICVRGPQVMKGYWKRPDATAEVLIDGHMLRTGDVGYMADDGYTYIIDRDKDLILVGGFNVFPRVVEEAIMQHPAVKEVTVIGIPDDYRGESPKAFVTLVHPDEDLTEAKLLTFLKERLGKHEIPSAVEFRDELPKTMIGKLSKKELVAEEKAKYEARKQQKRAG
ncbi:long-chain-fatty-acid--CoA ligase [Emcibacter nanhaiensis]|uniref:Long-chain fatty acid--CoA ligase n=1 Tax=Emcibacter nanhaiensis TaxID=1505037 RepID=A0A501PBP8_9PROT|nr:long-chain fatty acid--CoA ligase [Emcibacter nanhaiensis]TPD57511.1 long-chain fatty acid--CoA ligase [Emcibacter nanhaiensis]